MKKLLSILLTFSVISLYASAPGMGSHVSGFVANTGQIIDQNHRPNPGVLYLFQSRGLNIQLRRNGFSYDTYSIKPDAFAHKSETNYNFHRVDVEFVGASHHPQVVAGDEIESPYSTRALHGKVTYKNIYSRIDLEFVLADGRPKFNFIVHEGGNASVIRWRYHGAAAYALHNDKVILSVAGGKIEEDIPVSFENDSRTEVAVHYLRYSDNEFGFNVPAYDHSSALTIDPYPALLGATYFGGRQSDVARGVATDAAGNVFITGQTYSDSAIATAGAYQSTFGGSVFLGDAVVAKFNAGGTLLWSTYLGGSSFDCGYRVSTDASGNCFVMGETFSTTGISTAGAHQPAINAGQDLFVAKFDATGSLLWSSYYGGPLDEYASGIATDASGNVYFSGYTYSTSGISTAGAHQVSHANPSSEDMFIVKFNALGVRQWGTYYGGAGFDISSGLATDASGNVLIVGYTNSLGSMATAGAAQTSNVGTDACIAKFSTTGARVWASYFGGNGIDKGYGISCDPSGNVFITGETNYATGLATAGAHQTSLAGSIDAFVAKFNSNGTAIIWSTYYGGTGADYGIAITADAVGNSYLTGNTASASGIATSFAQQASLAGGRDAFLVRFNPAGVRIAATYFGGSGNDDGYSIASDSIGRVYIAGATNSASGIAQPGAHQTLYLGNNDGLLAKFITNCPAKPIISLSGPAAFCTGGSVTMFTDVPQWSTKQWYKDGLPVTGAIDSFYNTAVTGQYKLLVSTSYGCADTSAIISTQLSPQPKVGFTQASASQCFAVNNFFLTDTSSVSSGTITRQWRFSDGDVSSASPLTKSFASAGTHTAKLIVTTSGNCSDSVTKNLVVYPQPRAGFSQNALTQCFTNHVFTLTDTSTLSQGTLRHLWYFVNTGDTSTATVVNKTFSNSGIYLVKLYVASDHDCIDSTAKLLTVRPSPRVGFTQNNFSQCFTGNSFALTDTSTISSGTMTRQWDFADGTFSGASSFNKSYTAAGTYNIKLVEVSNTGCADSVTKTFTIYGEPRAGYTQNNFVQCLAGNSFVLNDTSVVSVGTTTRTWYFGDGGTSGNAAVNKTFANAGTFSIKLVSTSGNACSDSVTKVFTVHPSPAAGYTQNNFAQCFEGNSFNLNDTSVISSGTLSREWNFGNGETSTQGNVNKSFNLPGTYNIKLVSTSNNSCKDSVTKIFTVHARPTAGFTQNTLTQCRSGNTFTFTDTSSIVTGTMTALWKFSDGSTASGTVVNKSFATTGTFSVKLIVTSGNNCQDSVSRNVTVLPSPQVGFSQNNFAQCREGNQFVMSDTSVIASGTLTRLWKLSTGETAASALLNKTFVTAGSFSIKLVETSDLGCADSISKTFLVHPQPAAGFTHNTLAQCMATNSFLLTDTSTIESGLMTRTWSFGDATTSGSASFNKSFTLPGAYSAKLLQVSDFGCRDSFTKTLTVYPSPSAGYSQNTFAQCLSGNSFAFNDTSVISSGTLTRLWELSSGDTYTAAGIAKSFSAEGSYQVKLVITSNNGCKDSATKSFTVHPQPRPGFTINNSVQCLNGNSFSVTDTSTVSAGLLTRTWTFSTGETSTAGIASKSFAVTGIHNVKLVSQTDHGCKDSVTKNLTVNASPKAGYTQNLLSECLTGNSFTFTDTSTISSGTLTSSWDAGDGSSASGSPLVKSFSAYGTYQVKLIATSGNNCKDSVTRTFTVYPQTAVGFSNNSAAQCLTNNYVFTDTSSVATGTYTRLWRLGDGTTSTLSPASKSYGSAGTYTITLITVTDKGCTDSVQKDVTINPFPTPKAGFAHNALSQCFSGHSFVLGDTSTISSGTVTRLWRFSTGDTTSSAVVIKSFGAAGTYTVKLVEVSDHNCSDSAEATFMVRPQPVAGFSQNSNAQCFYGNQFILTDTSYSGPGNPTRLWTLSTGDTSGAAVLSRSFPAEGTYSAKLRVTTIYNCSDSITKSLIVFPSPRAGFSQNTLAQCLSGNVFTLTDTSVISQGGLNRVWELGTADLSSLPVVTKTFPASGAYTVKLFAISSNNCIDSAARSFTVHPQTQVGFSINNPVQCFGNNFIFADTSIASGPYTRTWKAGDNTTSTGFYLNKTYAVAGVYNVQLATVTANGCRDSVTQVATLNPKPAAGFTHNLAAQCLSGNSFQLNDTSFISSGSVTTRWDFDDNTSATTGSFAKSFATPGVHTAKLVVTSDKSCSDSVTKTFTVHPQPVAGFAQNNFAQCQRGNNFTFTDTSTVATGIIITRLWDLGDGNYTTGAVTSKSFATPGAHSVKLLVMNERNCSDSVTKTFITHPQPVAAFTTGSISQCVASNNFTFTNNSTLTTGSMIDTWDFGDSTYSSGPVVNKAYTRIGTFNVKLLVISDKFCTDSTLRTVAVHPAPDISLALSGPTTFCSSGSLTLSAVNAPGVQWQWKKDGGNAAGDTAAAYIAKSTGSYKVVIKTAFGCTDSSAPVAVTTYPSSNPVVTTSGPSTFCSGQKVVIQADTVGVIAFRWLRNKAPIPGETNASLEAYGPGVYRAILSNLYGCNDSTIEVPVTVTPKPLAMITPAGPTSVCIGNTVTLNAPVAAGAIYQWRKDGADIPAANSAVYSTGVSGIYAVTVTAGGCKDSSPVVGVIIHPLPVVVTQASGPTTFCQGNKVDITASSDLPSTFQWKKNDIKIPGDTNATTSITTSGVYSVAVRSLAGCADSSSSFSVTVNPMPFIGAIQGAATANYFDTVTYRVSPMGGVEYKWEVTNGTIQNGQGTNSILVKWMGTGTGIVKLTATNPFQCFDTASATIELATVVVNRNYSLFPNPTREQVVVSCAGQNLNGSRITITDMFGKKVFESKTTEDTQQIVVRTIEFADGVYTVTIEQANKKSRMKFVKE